MSDFRIRGVDPESITWVETKPTMERIHIQPGTYETDGWAWSAVAVDGREVGGDHNAVTAWGTDEPL